MARLWLALMIFCTLCAEVFPGDPCTNHRELNDPHRSTTYVTEYPETPLCDIDLLDGWYRFTGATGGMMPTTCPDIGSCGTFSPIWMDGAHPTEQEGVVTRTACVNVETGNPSHTPCCERSRNMEVKNCGGFYVYYLHATPACPIAYCAGGKETCPTGQWSPSGLLDKDCRSTYPNMTHPPLLTGPIVADDSKSFHFVCEVQWSSTDPLDPRFEVVWTFDGQENASVTLQGSERHARLDGSALMTHVGTYVGCQVRGFYNGFNEAKGPLLKSNVYLADVSIAPRRLIVSEGEPEQIVTISSTIPIACDNNPKYCCINFNLNVGHKQVAANGCRYTLCADDWDSKNNVVKKNVSLMAYRDMVPDGDHNLLLTFHKLIPVGGPYMQVFGDYIPPQIHIEVKDVTTSVCSTIGDPHFQTFDGKYFNLFEVGDFTIYEVPSMHFQVQIRTWLCHSRVSCICGVMIREQNNAIKIDQCDQISSRRPTSPIITKVRELSEETIITRSSCGRKIGVYLPSGAEIKLESFGHNKYNIMFNVWLTLPGIYRNKGKGLCGTNDGDTTNDFTYPNGDVSTNDGCNRYSRRGCEPKEFAEAWRVNRTSLPTPSYFEKDPPYVEHESEVRYCDCTHDTINCTFRADKRLAIKACYPNCKPVNDDIGWTRNARKRSSVYEDRDEIESPYFLEHASRLRRSTDWDTDSVITESEARALCENEIQKSQLYSACHDKENLTEIITAGCMQDIQHSGSTMFLESVSSAFTSSCQVELERDPANYVIKPNGESVIKPEYFDDVCSSTCQDHGHCGSGGKCVCDQGWEGESCHLEAGKGPQLDMIRSGPLCDRMQRPCEQIFIDASNIALSDDLTCQVEVIDDNGNILGIPVMTEATLVSSYRLACNIPKSTASSQFFRVSASNDGHLFGNALVLHVFDSTCLDCDDAGCKENPTACHITNRCYSNGQKNPQDSLKVCDVLKSSTSWTLLPNSTTQQQTTASKTSPPPTTATSKTTQNPTTTTPKTSQMPSTSSPTLTGPDIDSIMSCSRPDGVSGSLKVWWMVNGNVLTSVMLGNGVPETRINARHLPRTGTMACQIEVNGVKFTSNSIALDGLISP